MRFGKTLRSSIYPPWKDQYIDYAKLKAILRDDRGSQDDERPWTEDDENRFCDEVLNVELDKVATFQAETLKSLEQRATKASEKVRDLAPEDDQPKGAITQERFKEIEEELERITNDTKELKKYSNINYTGFFKIVKKHDKLRGQAYKVRPMLQVQLAKRPFNSETGYGPLLNKLSVMYFVVRQNLDSSSEHSDHGLLPDAQASVHSVNGDRYIAYKFWVHPDNMLEVKTYILRHLPILVYSQQSAKEVDYSQQDPTITSLYFDSEQFDLYSQKVNGEQGATSLRVRWYGQLNRKPELLLEQKTIHQSGSSEEQRFPIKDKYIQPFIKGEYGMEKSIEKMERQGQPEQKVQAFKGTVAEIREFIQTTGLEPMLRANYSRIAFQRPQDDRVRVSIDQNLAFIREDALDSERPCRYPDNWHRTDIDDSEMTFPFKNINRGEISKFPFAVLEIKVKEDTGKKSPQWVDDLMASHLVHKVPRFSKFVHGVASLFEDHVNNLPSWLTELETDIRKDPETAFREEEQAKARRAEDELVVGSFLGASKARSSYNPAVSSPVGKSYMQERLAAESPRHRPSPAKSDKGKSLSPDERTGEGESRAGIKNYGTLSSLFTPFSASKYSEVRRRRSVQLPEGVTKPTQLIKDSGPLQIEPKVWLANERTFLKWQHICVLLGGLSVGLYTAAGSNFLAELMGIAYIVIAIFGGGWGYYMHRTRRNMIVARSGKDFDNMVGPAVITLALMVALVLNFVFKYREALARYEGSTVPSPNA